MLEYNISDSFEVNNENIAMMYLTPIHIRIFLVKKKTFTYLNFQV